MDQVKNQRIQAKFKELFTSVPMLVRSPGRINLIGEHTDYNEGFVLPAAIDKEIVICVGLNGSESCNLYAWDMQEQYSFELANLSKATQNWANYIIGVVEQLQKRGYSVPGFDCVFGGDIPLGAGLSSSAALECGIAFGLSSLTGVEISRIEIARLAQAAEREFVGVQCGLMDQYANMFGQEGHLIQLDCRKQKHETVQVDFQGYCLWLFNTNVKHELGNSEYNVRRKECEEGVEKIRNIYPEVTSLRDCNSDMLIEINDPVVRQRCQYVIEENQRVLDSSRDLVSGDFLSFGKKLYLSHQGLRDKYQVSCPELDLLVELTRCEQMVLGSRMMGGGFGGCTINLIKNNSVEPLISSISNEYKLQTGKEMSVYPVNIANGTSLSSKELIT